MTSCIATALVDAGKGGVNAYMDFAELGLGKPCIA